MAKSDSSSLSLTAVALSAAAASRAERTRTAFSMPEYSAEKKDVEAETHRDDT